MKMKIILFIILFSAGLLFVKQISAQVELPRITTACEMKNGSLFGINDGFSLLKKCPKGSRIVMIIGEQGIQGPVGATGPQGLTGPAGEQGPKGDKGDSGDQSESKSLVFAMNRPQPFYTDPVDTSGGFTKMTITVGTTGNITGYALLISPDGGTTWIEQIRVNCDGGAVCPVITIPVVSNSYKFGTGTASGNITATALLEK